MAGSPHFRFLSTHFGRIDGKGRASVPAAFRAALEADGYPGVFLHQALEVPALDCGGFGLLGEIDALIARFPPYSEARDLMSTALLGGAEVLRLDPEGRIVLPDRFKAYLGLGSDVVFVGLGDRFRIWEPERFSAYLDGARSRLREVRSALSRSGDIREDGPGGNGGAGPMRGVRET